MTREETILDCLPQVHMLARKLLHRVPYSVKKVRLEELVSDGTLGMIKAVDSFEPGRGLMLKTYAERRINGEMYDGLRSRGNHRKGRPDYYFFDVEPMLTTLRDPSPDPETLAIRNEFSDHILKLPKRDRSVLTMFYLEQKTLKQIGKKLHCHGSRISQLKKAAVFKMAA